ncbi:MAG: FAD-dependent monooxygenase [Alphaproteobacteria bacterium]|nr:FAD-dependent monooxygenase [Alphaproteobacteria bacterium]
MQNKRHYDIAVIGDGLSGQAMTLALAAAGARVWLGGNRPPTKPAQSDAPRMNALHTSVSRTSARNTDAYHTSVRSMALTPSSVAMLQQIGVCDKLPTKLAPLRHMQIADGLPSADMSSGNGLYFTTPPDFSPPHAADKQNNALAYVTCNNDLAIALRACLKTAKNITYQQDKTYVENINITTPHATLNLSDGTKLKANLLVACDGRDSPLREQMNIDTYRTTYQQTALIANFTHSQSHQDTAYQFFCAAGTLATLPMGSHSDGTHNSALIWVERPERAETLCKAGDDLFMAELAKKLGGLLGDIKTVSKRAHYPLQLVLARHYTRPHFVLAGEAAHVIHPLAGQGYNLTLRDAARLANGVYEARRLGLAIEAAPQLAAYESARRLDAFSMAAATHALNFAFTRKTERADILAPLRRAALHWANYVPGLPAVARRVADMGVADMGAADMGAADMGFDKRAQPMFRH